MYVNVKIKERAEEDRTYKLQVHLRRRWEVDEETLKNLKNEGILCFFEVNWYILMPLWRMGKV